MACRRRHGARAHGRGGLRRRRSATRGCSTSSARRCAAATGTRARTSASSCAGSTRATDRGPTRGAVLVIGVGQRTTDLSVYQNTLQNWLADSAFWTDMATYVSDWSQEVYGDVRSYAVPGVPTVGPPRLPERLPPAQARARGRRAGDDRARALVPAGGIQPARERRLAARHRLRLDDGSRRADGGLRLGAG